MAVKFEGNSIAMVDDVTIDLEDGTFRWSCDPHNRDPESCWSWSDERTNLRAADHSRHQLNRVFFEEYAQAIADSLTTDEYPFFYKVFRSMRATDDDFKSPSMQKLLAIADPDRFQEVRFDQLPAPGHSPLNSPELRDWFFGDGGSNAVPPNWVLALGNGPFGTNDLLEFLCRRRIFPVQYQRTFNLGHLTDWKGHVIVGREGWEQADVDALIDNRRGKSLRIYSQEMFLAMLHSRKDPFDAPLSILFAFRAGHPALEFVSDGWPDWVSTTVAVDPRRRSRRSAAGIARQSESPLHELGYKVGRDGAPTSIRRAILADAFTQNLPQVGDESYMAEWGAPNSSTRLRKIANTIASICRNMKRREQKSDLAISQWESDLTWLKDRFHHGHILFQWPDTHVS